MAEYAGRLDIGVPLHHDVWIETDGEPCCVYLHDLLKDAIGQQVTIRMEHGQGRWWLVIEGEKATG